MKLTIKITKEVLKATMMCGTHPQDDIASGCAISFAIREVFPLAITEEASIYPFFGSDDYSADKNIWIDLPQNAQDFITEFDGLNRNPNARLNLPEISFEIEVPDSIIEEIGIDEAKAIISKSSTLELA